MFKSKNIISKFRCKRNILTPNILTPNILTPNILTPKTVSQIIPKNAFVPSLTNKVRNFSTDIKPKTPETPKKNLIMEIMKIILAGSILACILFCIMITFIIIGPFWSFLILMLIISF
jgi:hypothetical protein